MMIIVPSQKRKLRGFLISTQIFPLHIQILLIKAQLKKKILSMKSSLIFPAIHNKINQCLYSTFKLIEHFVAYVALKFVKVSGIEQEYYDYI